MKQFGVTALLCILLSLNATSQVDITKGTWLSEGKTGQIQFFVKDSKMHGKVVWMKEPGKKDKLNPDKALQERLILGSVILHDFVSKDKKNWADGKIYDPESGKTYSAKITVISEKELDVRGYVGTPLLGRTTKFTKVAPSTAN